MTEQKIYNIPEEILKDTICLLSTFKITLQEIEKKFGHASARNILHVKLKIVLDHFEISTGVRMPEDGDELNDFSLSSKRKPGNKKR